MKTTLLADPAPLPYRGKRPPRVQGMPEPHPVPEHVRQACAEAVARLPMKPPGKGAGQ
jgi:hypothetical protein